METRANQRTTRSSARGVQKPARPNRNKASGVVKPRTQTSTTRKRTARKINLPCALEAYHKQSFVDPNASCLLLNLPHELFTHFTTFALPETLICLSLTCKLALQYIGPECWKHPDIKRRQNYARLNLMRCLSRDEPEGLTFCEYCNTLHPPLKPPRTHRPTKLTKLCMSQWANIDYFPQVQDPAQAAGYSLLYMHLLAVFETRDTDTLAGHYATSKHPAFNYELASSATWTDDGRLVLQHKHYFLPKSREAVNLADVLSLPVRLCPHNSTTTTAAEKARYVGTFLTNTPLLTHAITAAFPAEQRTGAAKRSVFRGPAPSEQTQMDRADAGEDVLWKCRACTTKFKIAMARGAGLEITSWHCFGADLAQAGRYWEWLVRREVANLGAGKRNSEYWFPAGRSVPDFKIAGE